MKTLLTFALCLCAIVAHAANPSTKSFRAVGGLTVTSNDVTGVITYDGSGVVASGTNSSMQVSTNNVAAATMASNINFTAGNNVVLKGTNIGSTAHINYGMESNLTFYSTLGTLVLGTWDGRFGFSNATTASMSMWLEEPDTGNDWELAGTLVATNVTLTAIPGTGTNVGITAGGTLFRTTVSGGSGTIISNANMLFVATDGNNSTAVRGRRDLPYLTTAAAKAAAVAGDTVVCFPGHYPNSSNLLKGGVNWIGYGATLSYTNLTNDTGRGIFDDRFSGAVTSSISGFSFLWSAGMETTNAVFAPAGAPTNVLAAIVLTNPTSQVSIDFDRLEYRIVRQFQGPSGIWVDNCTNSFIRGNLVQDLNLTEDVSLGLDDSALDIWLNSQGIGVYWTQGDLHIDIKRNIAKLYSIYCAANAGYKGNLHYSGDYLFGHLYLAGPAAGGGGDWKTWVTVKELAVNRTNIGTAAVTYIGGGKLYLSAQKISSAGTAPVPLGTAIDLSGAEGEIWLDCQKVASTGSWLRMSGGTIWANVQEFNDLGTVDIGIHLAGGTLNLRGGTMSVSNTTGTAIQHLSGNLNISGLRVSTTNSVGHPVILATNGAVFANCTFLSGTNWAIRATNTFSANIQGCWGNKPETNVAYLVGPWTVDSNVR